MKLQGIREDGGGRLCHRDIGDQETAQTQEKDKISRKCRGLRMPGGDHRREMGMQKIGGAPVIQERVCKKQVQKRGEIK